MSLSVEQLARGLTKDQSLAFLLDTLTSLGFDSTSWHEGSVQRNLLEAVSLGMAGTGSIIQELVKQVLVKPEGLWLDARGEHFLQLPRLQAVRAVRSIRLTSTPSAPVHVITEASRFVAGSAAFLPFELLAPITLNPGSSATLAVRAVEGGTIGNTLEVPTAEGFGGVASEWVGAPTIPGVEVEGDARYRIRQDRRFSELTYSVGLRAYELWALTAAPSVRRARAINNYPTPNAVRVILDPGTPEEINQVEVYLYGKNPPNDLVTVSAANVVSYAIDLSPRVKPGVTVASIRALLDKVILEDMPIGGWRISEGLAGRLLRERLAEALLCQNGAYSAGITVPTEDIVLGETDVVDPVYTITPTVGVPL